jgi:hypothetical protein
MIYNKIKLRYSTCYLHLSLCYLHTWLEISQQNLHPFSYLSHFIRINHSSTLKSYLHNTIRCYASSVPQIPLVVIRTHFEKHPTQYTEQIGLSKRIACAIENVALTMINVIGSVQIRKPVCCGERVMTALRHDLQYWSARQLMPIRGAAGHLCQNSFLAQL